jgi:ATP-dependent Clp protease ATP-binding subunit ClpC
MKLVSEYFLTPAGVTVKEREGMTPKLRSVLKQAEEEAVTCHSEKIGTEHVLLAIMRTPECAATRLMASMDVNMQKLFTNITPFIFPEYILTQKSGFVLMF